MSGFLWEATVKNVSRELKEGNAFEPTGDLSFLLQAKAFSDKFSCDLIVKATYFFDGRPFMSKKMNRLCEGYIHHARLIGLLYCWIPTIAWFVVMIFFFSFRGVYLLRLVIALLVGSCVAAWINDYGVRLWLIKHSSKEGPATAGDGFLIGAGVGIGITFLPPLTSLIATNHPEQAKVFIILSWSAGIGLGGLIGSVLASIYRKHVDPMGRSTEESQK